MINDLLIRRLLDCRENGRKITFLVGAGLSAESGIPTFRGADGYWTVGSVNYRAEEIATKRMFNIAQDEVWKWYLYRKSVTDKAQPNRAHHAMVQLEKYFDKSFALISQNVDGLHIKAGSSLENLYLIHGDLSFVRCAEECTKDLIPFPESINLSNRDKNQFTFEEQTALTCSNCGGSLRPHVLWFDEYYNEEYYRWDSVIKLADKTDVLFIIGTSGATNLPQIFTREVLACGGIVVEVNTEESHFTTMINKNENCLIYRVTAGDFLENLLFHLKV